MKVQREERVLRITLDDAARRNALSERACHDVLGALDEAWADDGVGCVLLDAEGPVFCAGMDLDEATAADAASRTMLHERLFTFGFNAPKPVVAAVQGPALGGGVGLIANSHVVVAAQGVQFGLTEMRLGMWPMVIWRAAVAVFGERRTLELTLTGRLFSAQDALQFGLVHEIAPAIELDDRATATAHLVANASPLAVRLGMDYAHRFRGLGLEEGGALARSLRNEIFAGGDFTEGVRAFREKRRPAWPSLAKEGSR